MGVSKPGPSSKSCRAPGQRRRILVSSSAPCQASDRCSGKNAPSEAGRGVGPEIERRQRDAEFAGAGPNRLLDAADWMMTAASSDSRKRILTGRAGRDRSSEDTKDFPG